MEADDIKFKNLITVGRQYVVPVWQREYSWAEPQWEDLWKDLMKLFEQTTKEEATSPYFQHINHFMGSIVIKPKKLSGVEKYTIIDGQQRLTTLMVILAVIRDVIKPTNNNLSKTIEATYLLNSDIKTSDERYKLCPTDPDRPTFERIINGEQTDPQDWRLLATAYGFFKERLQERIRENSNEPKFLEKLKDVIVDKLWMVQVILDMQDDANRIFETLNTRGLVLEKADLVRNYFMMKVRDDNEAEQLYKHTWLPMQNGLKSGYSLTMFFRDYLRMDKHTRVKADDIYPRIQEALKFSSEDETRLELQKMKRYSEYYERLLFLDKEFDSKIRTGIRRLNQWDVGTAYPLLLKVYNAYSNSGVLSSDDFYRILKTIESYAVRRHFCELKTNVLSSLFTSLCELDDDKLADSLSDEFLEHHRNRRWPTDDEFKEHFATFPIYKSGTDKCRLILDTLEEVFRHPEPVDPNSLTIEHIMPQTLDENGKWQEYLGNEWERIYDTYRDTIGNLTLVAQDPNTSLSNELYPEKRERWYSKSHVELTREIAQKWDHWGEDEINSRASLLLDRAIRIWWRPG